MNGEVTQLHNKIQSSYSWHLFRPQYDDNGARENHWEIDPFVMKV